MKNLLYKKSKKDEYEKEKEEVERLVKKSPTDKPPRTDKNRNRLKVDDPDLDSSDKDLSMNYKDIGGSVKLIKRVALRTLQGFEFDEDELDLDSDEDIEEETEDIEEETEEDAEDDEDSSSEDEDDPSNDDDAEDLEKDRPASDKAILDAAIKLYERPASELQHMLNSDELNTSEKGAVKQALRLKTRPKPPNWDRDEVFEDGVIKLKARHLFRTHMENWDAKQFADNLTYFKEKYLNESLTESRGWYERYYKVMIQLVEDSFENFKKEDHRPLKVDDVLKTIPDPESEFNDKDRKTLKEHAKDWRSRLRRTSLDQMDSLIEEAKKAQEDVEDHLSNKAAWITTLQYILKGSLEMKKTTTDEQGKKIASAIRSGFRKAAQYRGLPGPLKKDDGFKPPSPKWRLKDPLDLDEQDFALLVFEAMEFLKKPFLANELVEYDADMACRIALDYSIFTLDSGKYDRTIDAPTYNALLGLLSKVHKN